MLNTKDTTQIIAYFTMDLDMTNIIHKGRFFIVEVNHTNPSQTRYIGRWVATSGKRQQQNPQDRGQQRYGPIPSVYDTRNVATSYKLFTKPNDLRANPGIAGNAYLITPESVLTNAGVARSELMLHRDVNSDSTLGCIGIMESFDELERTMEVIAKRNSWIPLLVGHIY